MDTRSTHENGIARRTVLRNGAVVTGLLGTGLTVGAGSVAATSSDEFVTAVAREGRLAPTDAKRILDAFINATTKALASDGRASCPGFGSFSISKRSARTGRNPQTGKEIQIAARKVVTFKAGAELSKSVN